MKSWRTLLIAGLAAAAIACESPAAFSVDRIDVSLGVRPDGAIAVRQTTTVRFDAASPVRFEQRIARERAESLTFEFASIDGLLVQPNQSGDASLVVDDGDGLTVQWTFPGKPGAPRMIELAYRANGAVAVRGARGVIRYTAIPANRAYGAGTASVRLGVDPSLHLYDGAGIAEAGWAMVRTADGVAGERAPLAAGDSATVMAEVAIDTATVREPEWQQYEDWATELIPAFVSGGLFILVIGAGVLWIIRFQYPRPRAGAAPFTDVQLHERRAVRSGLRTTGVVAVVLAVVLAPVTRWTLSQYGWWPMCLAGSIVIVGVVFLAVSRRIV